jgi:hypothetical protein
MARVHRGVHQSARGDRTPVAIKFLEPKLGRDQFRGLGQDADADAVLALIKALEPGP